MLLQSNFCIEQIYILTTLFQIFIKKKINGVLNFLFLVLKIKHKQKSK